MKQSRSLHRSALLCFVLSVASVSGDRASGQELPGDSLISEEGIGPVLLSMSEAELRAVVGPSAILRSHQPLGEGFCGPGSRVFPDTPEEIGVLWSDSTYSHIVELSIREPGSPWRTGSGVRIGSDLDHLEQVRGGPVHFLGFGWDYGGAADWTEPGLVARLRVSPPSGWQATVASEPGFDEIWGDRRIGSDHPVIEKLTIRVWRIALAGSVSLESGYMCPRPQLAAARDSS